MTNTTKTIQELAECVRRTQEIDESGDATLTEYMLDQANRGSPKVRKLFIGFLVWANGTEWEQFLDTAEVGDVPPKPKGKKS